MKHIHRNSRANARRLFAVKRDRDGAVLVVVLVAIGIVAALLVTWTQSAVRDSQRHKADFRGVQAQWLVNSGMDRARAQLAKQPDYQGETWEIPAEQLDGVHAARVTIRPEPSAMTSTERPFTIQVDYPIDPALRQRRSNRISLPIPSSGDSS